jgi:uncharacterized protein YybS (DUF2232 family)
MKLAVNGGGWKLNNSRKITEGGILLAVYVLLLFITVQIPFLGMITFFFLPVPFVLIMIKEKLSWLFGFLVVASILTIIFGTILSVPLTLFAGCVGIVIGYHLKYGKPIIQMIISSTLTIIVCLLILYSVTIFATGVNIIEGLTATFEESMKTSMNLMESVGQPVPENVEQQMRDSIAMIQTLVPSALVIASMMFTYLFILAAQPFIKRFSDKKVKWPLFRNLRLPKSLLWYYIIVLVVTLFVEIDKGGYLNMAIMNVLFILQFFMLLQGFSLLFYVSHLKGWVKAIPIILVIVSLLNPIMLTIVRILGIIDLSFPFREAISKPK